MSEPVKKKTPFDYVKSLNKKEYIFDELNDRDNYSAYVVDKAMSFFPDCVLLANEMNKLGGIDPKQHYDFYFHAVSRGNRYSKWHKGQREELATFVSQVAEMNYARALEVLDVLGEEEIEQFRKEMTNDT